MIQTIVRCDATCDSFAVMWDDVVPDHWVRWDGRHYCSPTCFAFDARDGGE